MSYGFSYHLNLCNDIYTCYFCDFSFSFSTFPGVWLIYNVLFVLGLQHGESAIDTHISVLFPHAGYYRTLSRPPCAGQQVRVSYLLYIQ